MILLIKFIIPFPYFLDAIANDLDAEEEKKQIELMAALGLQKQKLTDTVTLIEPKPDLKSQHETFIQANDELGTDAELDSVSASTPAPTPSQTAAANYAYANLQQAYANTLRQAYANLSNQLYPGLIGQGYSNVTKPQYPAQTNKTTDLTEAFLNRHVSSNARSQSTIPCPDCGQTFTSESKLRIHSVSHTTEAMFHCPLCTLKYKRASDLNRHMKRKHDIRLRDYISNCQKMKQQTGMNIPAGLPYGKQSLASARPATEPSRPAASSQHHTALYAAQHMAMKKAAEAMVSHSQALPTQAPYSQPPIVTPPTQLPSTITLSQDIPLDLSNKDRPDGYDDRLQCTSCSYTTKDSADLKRHVQSHSTEKGFKCNFCNRRYKYEFDCNVHIKKMHTQPVRELSVDVELDYSRTHKRKQSAPKPLKRSPMSTDSAFISALGSSMADELQCAYCPYVGKCKSEVDRHIRVHTGQKPYCCLFCEYSTPWRGDIKRHLLKLHLENPLVLGNIDELMKTIDSKAQITIENIDGEDKEMHDVTKLDVNANTVYEEMTTDVEVEEVTKKHLELSPVSQSEGPADAGDMTPTRGSKMNNCPYCSFTCEAPSKLKCHMEIHENLKRYKCVYCGKRSNWIWDVRKHIRKDHPGYEMNVDELDEDEAKATLAEYLCRYKSPVKKDVQYRVKAQLCTNHSTSQNLHSSLLISEQSESPVKHQYASLDGAMDISPESTPEKLHLALGKHSLNKNEAKSTLNDDRCRPYKCSACGRRSNWKWDINKHIKNAHAGTGAKTITMEIEEAKATMSQSVTARKSTSTKRMRLHFESTNDTDSDRSTTSSNQQVDATKNKKFRCKGCPYRSNFRSDISRHMRKLHKLFAPEHQVQVLGEKEAADSVFEYNSVWAPKKFSYSPEKQVKPKVTPKKDNEGISAFRQLCVVTPEKEETSPSKNNRKYKCMQCPYSHASKQNVVSHLAIHPKNKAFSCRLCGKLTDHRTSIHRHVRKFHQTSDFSRYVQALVLLEGDDQMGSYTCTICGQTSIYKASLKKHASDVHHVADSGLVIVCTTMPADIEPVVNDEHPKIPPLKIKVSKKATFTYKLKHAMKPKLQVLQSVKMQGRTMYKCNICPELSRSAFQARIHKTKHIPGMYKIHKCTICPYYVKKRRLLEQHMEWHGSENSVESEEELSDAEITFNHKISQQRREVSITPEKHQDVKVKRSRSLLGLPEGVRVSTVNGTRFHCQICPSSSYNRTDYFSHMTKHKPRPNRPLKCPQCNYWSTKAGVYTHKRTHTPEYIDKFRSDRVLMEVKKTKKMRKEVQQSPAEANQDNTFFMVATPLGAQDITKEPEDVHTESTSEKKCSVSSNSKGLSGIKKDTKSVGGEANIEKRAFLPITQKGSQGMKRDSNLEKKSSMLIGQKGSHSAGTKKSAGVPNLKKPILPSVPYVSNVSEKSPEKMEFAVPDLLDLACLKQTIITSKITSIPIPDDNYLESKAEANGDYVSAMRFDDEGQYVDRGHLKVVFHCDACPYRHPSEKYVKQHQMKHKKLNPNLMEHLKPSHASDTDSVESNDDTIEDENDNREPLVCHFCDFHVLERKELQDHMIVHSQQYKDGSLPFTTEGSLEPGCNKIDLKAIQGCIDRTKLECDSEYYVKQNNGNSLNRSHLKKWCCDRCAYNTGNELYYERHLDLHGSLQTYSCQWCDYSVPHLKYLKAHTKLHMKPNPNLLTLQSIANLQHLTEVSTDIAMISKFPDCVQTDDPVSHTMKTNDLDLWEHCAEFTPPKPLYLCERCPFTTYVRAELRTHLQGHVTISLTAVQCKHCDYKVEPNQQQELDEHVKLHFSTTNGEMEIEDEDADADADADNDNNNNETTNLKDCNSNATDKDTVCKYCDRQFNSVEQRNDHQRLHLVGTLV